MPVNQKIYLSCLFLVSTAISSSTPTKCGATFSERTGTFSSSNGTTSNETCEWRILANPGEKIVLTVTNIDIQKSPNCHHGHVEIKDGLWYHSPTLGKFCGHGILEPIRSTGNEILVVYVAKDANARGFLAEYEATCGDELFVYNEGLLQSPNYPDKYPPNKKCVWKIVVPEDKQARLMFETFELQNGDYLEVKDGFTEDSNLIGIYNSDSVLLEVISATNLLWVKFVSNGLGGEGFSANITNIFNEDLGCIQECVTGYECTCS